MKTQYLTKQPLNNLFPYYNNRANDNNGLVQQDGLIAEKRYLSLFVMSVLLYIFLYYPYEY